MITINKIDFPWEEGMTMQSAIKMAAADPRVAAAMTGTLMYMKNKMLIEKADLEREPVLDRDALVIIAVPLGG